MVRPSALKSMAQLRLCRWLIIIGISLLIIIIFNRVEDVVEKVELSRNLCQNLDAKRCGKALWPFKQRFRLAKKYKLLGCAIEKNFSTLLTAILCFLHNEDAFRRANRSLLNEEFHHRFCGTRNEGTNLTTIEAKWEPNEEARKSWAYIAITREPIDRFISGFVDKCLKEKTWIKYPTRCNGCKQNLTCFTEKMYARIISRSWGQRLPTTFDDDHFFPQSWRCQFAENFGRFTFLRYDASNTKPFFEELYSVFRRQNVPEEAVRFIDKSLHAGRTEHSTQNFELRRNAEAEFRASRHLMELVTRMYYFDFTLFGYPVPIL
ncbi:unnamed protein product, partial [Mesorhabditis spiculigera]